MNTFTHTLARFQQHTSSTLAAVFADVSMNTRPCSFANAKPCRQGKAKEERLSEYTKCTKCCFPGIKMGDGGFIAQFHSTVTKCSYMWGWLNV